MALSISGHRVKDRFTVEPGGGGSGEEPTLANTGPAPGTSFEVVTGPYTVGTNEDVSGIRFTGNVTFAGAGSSATNCELLGGATIAGSGPADVQIINCVTPVLYNGTGLNGLLVDGTRIGGDMEFVGNDQPAQIGDGDGANGLVITNSLIMARLSVAAAGGSPHWEGLHLGGVENFVINNTTFDVAPDAAPGSDDWNATRVQITGCLTLGPSFQGSTRAHCTGDLSGNYFRGGGGRQVLMNMSGTVNDNRFYLDSNQAYYTTEPGLSIAYAGNVTVSGGVETPINIVTPFS